MSVMFWYLQIYLLASCTLLVQSTTRRYQRPYQKCNQTGTYIPDENGKMCSYRLCFHGKYTTRRCPPGLQVTDTFLKRAKKGRPYRSPPCRFRMLTPSCQDTTLAASKTAPSLKMCGLDIGIVIDRSCSISYENKELVKKFIIKLLGRFKIGAAYVRVAGVIFAARPKVIQLFSQSSSNQATNYRFGSMSLIADQCRTHTDDALALVKDKIFQGLYGDRPDKKNILLVMSDGSTYHVKNKTENNYYIERTKRIGRELRKKGTECFVLGLPTNKNKTVGYDEWMEIGGDRDHVYELKFQELNDKIDELINRSCKDTVMKGWHNT